MTLVYIKIMATECDQLEHLVAHLLHLLRQQLELRALLTQHLQQLPL